MPVWLLDSISFAPSHVTSRPRRFVAYPSGSGVTVELVFEQFASEFSNKLELPAWEIRPRDTLQASLQRRMSVLEARAVLTTWESRNDVPNWASDVQLVVTLHGMHWSGYIFHDYPAMLEAARSVMKQIDGRNVLFFLAGWEGRY